MFDLVIRGGQIVDGTGEPSFIGDIGITQGRIVEIGPRLGRGTREIDASDCLVTPGWVDVHTHYDGQATWDPHLSPSTWHGVTSAIMGNCGVGFAPVKPDRREWLIKVMEGVEDIPGAVLTEGLQWDWETFPQYLDALDRRQFALDVGALIPHSAVRAYVMGDRAVHHDEAYPKDIAAMREIVREGMLAGAMGFSTTRTFLHKYGERQYPPGTFATAEEVIGIGKVLGEVGQGVFQMTSNHPAMGGEIPWMLDLARQNKLPVLFNLQQTDPAPDIWKDIIKTLEQARTENVPLFGAICGRPVGILFSWQSSLHPFIAHPTYVTIADLPLPQRLEKLRDPLIRQKILTEERELLDRRAETLFSSFHKIFRMDDNPDYEPSPDKSVASMAKATGKAPLEIIYDLMLERDGRAILYYPSFNYSNENLDHIYEWLQNDRTINSLSDGGAHCSYICDVSMPTFMMTHWVKGRTRGPRLPIELIVKRQAADTAKIYGLHDRGVLKPSYKADINIIDPDALRLYAPEFAYDLPLGGKRLVQRADGYVATIVNGVPVYEFGKETGALPGKVLRGAQQLVS